MTGGVGCFVQVAITEHYAIHHGLLPSSRSTSTQVYVDTLLSIKDKHGSVLQPEYRPIVLGVPVHSIRAETQKGLTIFLLYWIIGSSPQNRRKLSTAHGTSGRLKMRQMCTRCCIAQHHARESRKGTTLRRCRNDVQ